MLQRTLASSWLAVLSGPALLSGLLRGRGNWGAWWGGAFGVIRKWLVGGFWFMIMAWMGFVLPSMPGRLIVLSSLFWLIRPQCLLRRLSWNKMKQCRACETMNSIKKNNLKLVNNIKTTTKLPPAVASFWLAVLFGPALVPGLLRVRGDWGAWWGMGHLMGR